ncbi:transport and Golgi organization protein 1 homolog [Protopterus annectens]|uniref:transport and Golgi organization protein 1 homolog n=1 Tax=Protopterus annectens TaxID=7888 RepID=UPI001CFBF65E|nr:transport and Golgi organization protein 1 homolog [Protopterus annectens]
MAAVVRGSVAAYFLIAYLLHLAHRVTAATKGLDRTFAEYKRCADEECSMLICRGIALQDFTGPDCRFVSFRKGETVYVYYKMEGRTDRVWAGSVGSEFGYFPKNLIKIDHIYSAVEMEVPSDETDFVCFNGGEDDFDNYNVDDLLNISEIQEDNSVEDGPDLHSASELKNTSSEPLEQVEEEGETSINTGYTMDSEVLIKQEKASGEEQGVDTTDLTEETAGSQEKTSQSSAYKESNSYQDLDKNNVFNDEDPAHSPTGSVSTHPKETRGVVPDSIHSRDSSMSYGKSEVLDDQEKVRKQMIDLETNFGATVDAIVSGDEITRKVTSPNDNSESEDFENLVTESEDEVHDAEEVLLLTHSVEAVSSEAVSEDTQHENEQQKSISDSGTLEEGEKFREAELVNQDNSQLRDQKFNENKYSESREIRSTLGDSKMVEDKNNYNEGDENEYIDMLDVETEETQEKTLEKEESQEKAQQFQKMMNLSTTLGDTVIAVVSDDESTKMVTDPYGASFIEEAVEEDNVEAGAAEDKVYLLEMEKDTQEKSDIDYQKIIKLQPNFGEKSDITVHSDGTVNRDKETESDISEESEDTGINVNEQKEKVSFREYIMLNTTFGGSIDAVVSDAENTKKVTDPDYIDDVEGKEGKHTQVSGSKDDTDIYLIGMDAEKEETQEKTRISQQKHIGEDTKIPKTDEDKEANLSYTSNEENEGRSAEVLKKYDVLHATFGDTIDAVVSEAENTKKVTDPGYIDDVEDKEGKHKHVIESKDDTDIYLIGMDAEKEEGQEKTRISQEKHIEDTEITKTDEDKEANLSYTNNEENEEKAAEVLKKYDVLHSTFGDTIDAVVSEAENTKKVSDPGYIDDMEDKEGKHKHVIESKDDTDIYLIGMDAEKEEGQEKTRISQEKHIEDTEITKTDEDKEANLSYTNNEENEEKAAEVLKKYDVLHSTFGDTIDAVVSEAENTKKVSDPGYINTEEEEKDTHNTESTEAESGTHLHFIGMSEKDNQIKEVESQQKMIGDGIELHNVVEDKTTDLLDKKNEENEKEVIDTLEHERSHAKYGDTFDAAVSKDDITEQVKASSYIDTHEDDKKDKDTQNGEAEDDKSAEFIDIKENQEKEVVPKEKVEVLNTFSDTFVAVITDDEYTDEVTDPTSVSYVDEDNEDHIIQADDIDNDERIHLLDYEKEVFDSTYSSAAELSRGDIDEEEQEADMSSTNEGALVKTFYSEENEQTVRTDTSSDPHMVPTDIEASGEVILKDASAELTEDTIRDDSTNDMGQQGTSFKESETFKDGDINVEKLGISKAEPQSDLVADRSISHYSRKSDDLVEAVKADTDEKPEEQTTNEAEQESEEEEEVEEEAEGLNNSDINSKLHDIPLSQVSKGSLISENGNERQSKQSLVAEMQDDDVVWEKDESEKDNSESKPDEDNASWELLEGELLEDENALNAKQNKVHIMESGHDKLHVSTTTPEKQRVTDTAEIKSARINIEEITADMKTEENEEYTLEAVSIEKNGIADKTGVLDSMAEQQSSKIKEQLILDKVKEKESEGVSRRHLTGIPSDGDSELRSTESQEYLLQETQDAAITSVLEKEENTTSASALKNKSLDSSKEDLQDFSRTQHEASQFSQDSGARYEDSHTSHPNQEAPNDEPVYSESVNQLTILKAHFDDKHFERFHKFLGLQNILQVEAMFQDMEAELKLVRKNDFSYEKTEEALDRIFESSESSILKVVEEVLDQREVQSEDIMEADKSMFDEESSLLDDFQELAYILRQKYSSLSDSTPFAPGAQLPEKQSIPPESDVSERFAAPDNTVVSEQPLLKATPALPWIITALDSVILRAKENMRPYAEIPVSGTARGVLTETQVTDIQLAAPVLQEQISGWKEVKECGLLGSHGGIERIAHNLMIAMEHTPQTVKVSQHRYVLKCSSTTAMQNYLSDRMFASFASLSKVGSQGGSIQNLIPQPADLERPQPCYCALPLFCHLDPINLFTFFLLIFIMESLGNQELGYDDMTAVKEGTEAVMGPFSVCYSFLVARIVQLVSALPEDMRPGPDFYGVSWESVVVTALVGILTVLIFFWRTCLSVKSKMYQVTERQLSEKIRQLIQEKTEAVEQVSDYEKKILETQISVEKLKEVLDVHSSELTEIIINMVFCFLQLLREAEGWSERHSEFTEQIRLAQKAQKDLEESLAYKENEIEALTDCVMQLRQLDSESEAGNEDDNSDSWENTTEMANGELPEKKNEKLKLKIKQMMDVARMKTTLKIIEEERDNFQIKLSDEVTARHELEEQIKKLEHDTGSLMSEKSHLANEFKTMQQRLEILTELYQQKEMALQKKLTQEEFQRQEKEQKLSVADEKAGQAVEEVKMFRQRIQEMEDELQKTERSYKNQIASHEKKAHDNWLTARSAERALVEQKRETANLRQKLIEVNQKIAELQRPSIIRPTPGRPDRQIGMRRGPVSQEGSFGPSPVSGGAPSPPLMMDGLGRPPSAPLPRREVPRDRGDLDAVPGSASGPRTSSPSSAVDEMPAPSTDSAAAPVCIEYESTSSPTATSLQHQSVAVNPSPQRPPSFPGTPIMNSPASGAPVPPAAAPPPTVTRFGPPLPKGQYGPRIPPPVRGLLPPLGPRDLPPGMMDLGPGPLPPPPLGPRDYPPLLPPGARDLPPGPLPPPPLRVSPRDFPPGPRDFPPGPRDYLPAPRDFPPGLRDYPPGPRDFPPGPRDFPPGPRDFPSGPRDPRDYPMGLPTLRDYPPGPPPISHGTRDYPPPPQLRDIPSGPTPPPGIRDNPPGLSVVQKDCPPSSDIRR